MRYFCPSTHSIFNLFWCCDNTNSTCFLKLFLVNGILRMIPHKVQCSCQKKDEKLITFLPSSLPLLVTFFLSQSFSKEFQGHMKANFYH